MNEAEAYARHKNLKLAAGELGIKWQQLYVRLRKLGVPVTGDKARYGCAKDRLASKAERLFAEDVPKAIDSNQEQFQARIDFTVGSESVDVKASRLHPERKETSGKTTAPRWLFSINKQKDIADFFALYAFDAAGVKVKHVFLIPTEIATTKTTIVVPQSLASKWFDYRVERTDLADFFDSLLGYQGRPPAKHKGIHAYSI